MRHIAWLGLHRGFEIGYMLHDPPSYTAVFRSLSDDRTDEVVGQVDTIPEVVFVARKAIDVVLSENFKS